MTSSVIGALRVNLSADTAEFKRNLNQAEKVAQKFGNSIGSNIRSQIMAFGAAAAAAAGPAALGLLVKASIANVSAQVDLANRVGASVAAIQTLEHAAKLSGGTAEGLAKVIGVLNDKLGEAARTGAGPAYEALTRLGLSARELSNMDADQRIMAISDRMKELDYSSRQAGDTLKQLGVKAQEMRNLFLEGSDAIKASQAELKAWGVLLSDVDASKIESAGDALDKMFTVSQGFANQITVEMAPALERMATALGSVAEQGSLAKFVGQQIAEVFNDISEAIVRDTANIKVAMRYYQEADEILGAIMGGREGDSFFHVPDFTAAVEAHKQATVDIEKIWSEMDQRLNELKGPHPLLESVDNYIAKMQARRATGDGGGETEDAAEKRKKQEEEAAEELARYQEQLSQRLTALQESLMTEREAEMAAFEAAQTNLENALAAQLMTKEEFAAAAVNLQEAHAAKLADINEEIARDAERNVQRQLSAYGQLASDIGTVLDSIFGQSKIAAVATAVINTAQAVTRNLAEYPGPLGFAMAAAAAAAGAAEIATIRSTSSKGGGGGGSGRSSAASAPAAAPSATQGAAQPGNSQSLFISGINPNQIFTGEALRNLMEQIVDAQRDGAKIVLGQT